MFARLSPVLLVVCLVAAASATSINATLRAGLDLDSTEFMRALVEIEEHPELYKNALGAGSSETHYVFHQGIFRSFVIYTPPSYSARVATPVVFDIHFLFGSPSIMAVFTYMNEVADENGFLVVYPRGILRSFTAGPVCCGGVLWRDDVEFMRKVLEETKKIRNVDASRVYSTGQSNGGYMSHRLACDASDIFAAIAPVSGSSPWPVDNFPENCKPKRPVPIIAFHGTIDILVQYRDSVQTLEYWRRLNGCGISSSITYSKGLTSCESWSACSAQSNGARTNVTLCSSVGAGHLYWPSSPLMLWNDDVDTSREIWRFFSRFSL